MGELSEEKLKEMLEEYSQNLQGSINEVHKTVGQIKDRLENEQSYSWIMQLFSFNVAIFAIGLSVLIYGADKGNLRALNAGFGISMLSALLFLVGDIIYIKLTGTKRQR
jgi:hypothetical protein